MSDQIDRIRRHLLHLAQLDAKQRFTASTIERNKDYAEINEALSLVENELQATRTVCQTVARAAIHSFSPLH